jgi:hypothetical protein
VFIPIVSFVIRVLRVGECQEHSTSVPLLTTTLQTLLRYLSWIPIGYIMETSVIEVLVLKFFPAAQFQNVALQCLAEVALLKFSSLSLFCLGSL